ncbi:unnamed protein product [Somion occarium]|uniref:Glucose receptor Git3 N-terminal domain-containing protein n=1 Tax=Somion occarium TaxID=3059160 RepID=A0ABP1CHW8_9APHY
MDASADSDGEPAACVVPTTPFDFSIRLGLVFIVEAATLSAIAVLGLLSYIGYSVIRTGRGGTRHWSTATHVHWYFLSLMVSDLVQAVGGIINIQWISDAAVTDGPLCTAQGALKQLGDVGVALASLAIAIHTFSVIVFKWRPSSKPIIAFTVLSVIWLFLILIVSISFATHKGRTYYGNTQYWCWITSAYPVQRIALEYVWMWISSLLNIVLYVPIALVLKGVIAVSGGRLRVLHRRERRRLSEVLHTKEATDHVAIKMLFYPAVYTCTVLPIAIVRWRAFLGHCVPWAATVVADVIFASSGLLNVLLFTITRPNLLPRRDTTTTLPRLGLHSRSSSGYPQSTIYLSTSPRSEGTGPGYPLAIAGYKGTESERASSMALDQLPKVHVVPTSPSSPNHSRRSS